MMGAYNKKEAQTRISLVEKKLAENNYRAYTAFAYTPYNETGESANDIQIDAMLASQSMGIPTVNGYTATCPVEFGDFWRDYNLKALERWLSFNRLEIKRDSILMIK